MNFSEYFLEIVSAARPKLAGWSRLALLAISGAGGMHGTLAGCIAAVAALARRPKIPFGDNHCWRFRWHSEDRPRLVTRRPDRVRSCRLPGWLKMKNPDAPAVKREAEEDWGRGD